MKNRIPVIFGIVCIALIAYGKPAQSASNSGPLDAIIEGAKKEGTVSMITPSGMTAKGFLRLKSEIKEKFGVDLKFKYESGWFPKDYTKALMEYQAGVIPTFDMFNTSSTYILRGIDAGILEKVDWEPLILEGTPIEVIIGRPPDLERLHGYGLTLDTAHSGGIIYNPDKIPADQVPKTILELADPKWKGEVGINRATSVWMNQCWALGKEKGFAALRAIMKNEPVIGGSSDLMTRFVMGEVSLSYMSASFLTRIRNKGLPAEWQTLDVPLVTRYSVTIRKGAPHPNAAKLVALYLASPEGHKLMMEHRGMLGNIYYPGNLEHAISAADEKRGLPPPIMREATELLPFTLTDEAQRWEEEIKEILAGG